MYSDENMTFHQSFEACFVDLLHFYKTSHTATVKRIHHFRAVMEVVQV